MTNEIESAEIERSKVVFCEALRAVLPSLRRRGDSYIEKRIGKEKFEDASLDLWFFMIDGTAKMLTKHEELALACKLMRCLANYVQGVLGLDLCVTTVISSISMLQASTDRAFPGYASSKLLRYTILPQVISDSECIAV